MATMKTLQVTLGAAATQVTTVQTFARQALVQNNAAHDIRVRDSNVSATRGAKLLASANGSMNLGQSDINTEIDLSTVYIFGTAADVIDVIFTS
jgi:hypothetical protein